MAAGDTAQGRAATSYEDFFEADVPVWWKRTVTSQEQPEPHDLWLTKHPGSWPEGDPMGDGRHHGQLNPAHVVTEHEDGTITVSPSILCKVCGWHGYLEHGVWREV